MRTIASLVASLALSTAVAQAASDWVLRNTIPDSFDLAQSKAAKIAFTGPDGGPNTYTLDAALGYWWEFSEASETMSSSGKWGLVAEGHRATAAKSPTDTRRGSFDGWLVFSPNNTDTLFPVDVGVAYQDNRIKKLTTLQAFANASLVLRRPKNASGPPPPWVHLFWNASYLPFADGLLAAAAAPTLGFNLESANTGGSGQIMRGRVAYSASVKGQQGWWKDVSFDLSWVYQRRLQATGSFNTSAHDNVYAKASLNYSFNDNTSLVVERVEGEDPFTSPGKVYTTTVAFKVRFGKGP